MLEGTTRSKLKFVPGPLLGILSLLTVLPASPAPADEGIDFFENRIRPVLTRECYGCHSAKAGKSRGGLQLDTRDALLAGGDSGPAASPGKPEESLLIEAIRNEGLAMPPQGKLPDTVIHDFEHWVKIGLPDPRAATNPPPASRDTIDIEKGRSFWCYQRPVLHDPPSVSDHGWPLGMIDRFLLASLEANGLSPTVEADRTALIRRLSFDLVGLPPSVEEIDAFVQDDRPDAYERLVDRLLASPHFGERWARHWLDIVRFAESLTLRGFVFPSAWRYRDFVIETLNADRPFDAFLREQIAGDLLPASSIDQARRQRIATIFLMLGNTNLEEQDKRQLDMDLVDEQLDTIGKAFLAQTIGCARCHDHKFDPIPTRDYYAMAGILRNARGLEHANVSKWIDVPLPVSPEVESRLKEHEQKIAKLESKVKAARDQQAKLRSTSNGGILDPARIPGIVVDDTQAIKIGVWKESRFSGTYIGEGFVHDLDTEKGSKSVTFQPDLPATGTYEVWLAYVPGNNRAVARAVVFGPDGESIKVVDMKARPPIAGRFLSLGSHRFEKGGQGFVILSNEATHGHVVADAVVFLTSDQAELARNQFESRDPESEKLAGELSRLEAELKLLRAAGPVRETVMSVVEEAKPADLPIHIRGSVHSLGEVAPRGFLSVATAGDSRLSNSSESGRKELADWITAEENPLTDRVFVNRAWYWLFGAGLVRSVDNFGTTGDRPTHPELLDTLAVRFREHHGSIKWLVRELVTSRAYRLSTRANALAQRIDPENRLLSHAHRRRLEAECLRDAVLTIAGSIDRTMEGPGFPNGLTADYGFQPATIDRRSIYVPAFRNATDEIFEVFDGADPSLVVGRRNQSTVAPQALYLLNHDFLIESSRRAADRLLAEPDLTLEDRVDLAFWRILGRAPGENERRVATEIVSNGAAESWAALVQALFGSIDFRYLD
jgi:hypothetical protein